MKFLEELVATPLARAVGWMLLHSLWEGLAASLALAMVLAATRSARARYTAACVAMLATVAAAVFTFVRLMPDGMYGVRDVVALPFAPWNAFTTDTAASSLSFAAIVPWLAPVWIAGVWAFALQQIAGWFSASRLRIRGVCPAPERWRAEIERLRTLLRIPRTVQLLESCLAEVPVVIGHIRPVILVPLGLLSGLPAGQVEAILLHELAHIHRCDYLVNIAQRSIESLFFYNPAVWWISHVIRTERENCCDDVVVAISGDAREYACALTTIEENRWPSREPALAASGGNLMRRIQRLLNPRPASAIRTPALAAMIVLTTAAVTLAAWQPEVLHRAASLTQNQQKVADQSKYEKWLNEDVVYIITPRERIAFEKLTTDAQRDKFIEEFWQRRNSNPSSAVNTYKQRYYHQLAYANQHFGVDGKAGWRTDRGHVLIVYGPPDEIDSPKKPHAEEEWLYKHIDGKGDNVAFKFVDSSGTGDYKLVSGPTKEKLQFIPRTPAKKELGQLNVPKAGTDGYSYPKCVHCPQAQYSPAAYSHKFEGGGTFSVVITAEGRAQDIKLVKGPLPYGLEENAIDAMKKWRFTPASGPDGKPAAVRQNIEVFFHLY